MRTIKFRIWDKGKKKMYTEGWAISLDGLIGMFNIVDLSWEFAKPPKDSNLIPLQFTGLKSKSGKEIFEGDICKNGDWEEDAHAYNYRTEEVSWDKDNGCWQGWNPNEDGMVCEIIGNIYENPELLK